MLLKKEVGGCCGLGGIFIFYSAYFCVVHSLTFGMYYGEIEKYLENPDSDLTMHVNT